MQQSFIDLFKRFELRTLRTRAALLTPELQQDLHRSAVGIVSSVLSSTVTPIGTWKDYKAYMEEQS